MEYIVLPFIIIASLICVALICKGCKEIFFDIDFIHAFNDNWRENVSKRPYSDYEGTVWISKNLHRLQEVKDYRLFRDEEKPQVFNIKDTDYYVVFYNDWHFSLYYTRDIKKLGSCYSLCGCSLKSDWISFKHETVGRKVQKWYVDRYGTLGYQ